jgi:hypothetical protein
MFYVEAKQILNSFQFKLKFIDNYLGWLSQNHTSTGHKLPNPIEHQNIRIILMLAICYFIIVSLIVIMLMPLFF